MRILGDTTCASIRSAYEGCSAAIGKLRWQELHDSNTEDDIQMLVLLNDEFIVADHGCSLSCVRMLWTVG